MDFDDTNENARTKDSGVALPLSFQKSLRAAELAAVAASGGSRHPTFPLPQPPVPPREASDRVFTVAELEEKLRTTSAAIVNLQKQIVRGEETYYEETQQVHGSSLFRGFDTFIDSRADMTSLEGGRSNAGSAPRRMPGDYRWFSSSCSNISKYIKSTTTPLSTNVATGALPSTTATLPGLPPVAMAMETRQDLPVQVVHLTKEPRKKAKKQHSIEQPQPKQPQVMGSPLQPSSETASALVASSEKKRPLDSLESSKKGSNHSNSSSNSKEDEGEDVQSRPKKEAKTEPPPPKGRTSAASDGGAKKGGGKGGGRSSRKRKSVG